MSRGTAILFFGVALTNGMLSALSPHCDTARATNCRAEFSMSWSPLCGIMAGWQYPRQFSNPTEGLHSHDA
jgi:hypothetical protein